MRSILTCLLLIVTLFTFSQTFDDFSDGDFNLNPTWEGLVNHFEVNNEELHLIGPSQSDTSYLVTASNNVNDVEWLFKIKLDFATSGANYSRVYLMADKKNLKSNLKGYFILIGGTNDEVSLFRQDDDLITRIIDGGSSVVATSSVNVSVKVIRSSFGDWILLLDVLGGNNYLELGRVNDMLIKSSNYFGVFCKYTSTRSNKFFFDNFSINKYPTVDTIAPILEGIQVVDSNMLRLDFSEKIEINSAMNKVNYLVDNAIGYPNSIQILTDSSQVELRFPTSFEPFVKHTIVLQNLLDDSSNVIIIDSSIFIFEPEFKAEFNDVLISELMIDPSPTVGLPEHEYIELFNTTDNIIKLDNWSISDESSTRFFTAIISPKSYLLLVKEGTKDLYNTTRIFELNIPQLNNEDDNVILMNSQGNIIDSINYDNSWYKDDIKIKGGWSLELINLNSPCIGKINWGASLNEKGGTPGFVNSILSNEIDTISPFVADNVMVNDSIFKIVFSEPVDHGEIILTPFVPSIINRINEYDIQISAYKDCWGNRMNDFIKLVIIPEKVSNGDIKINEVLFNPLTGSSDYIEIVNTSSKILSIQEIEIQNGKDEAISLSKNQKLIYPNEYIVLTSDSNSVKEIIFIIK